VVFQLGGFVDKEISTFTRISIMLDANVMHVFFEVLRREGKDVAIDYLQENAFPGSLKGAPSLRAQVYIVYGERDNKALLHRILVVPESCFGNLPLPLGVRVGAEAVLYMHICVAVDCTFPTHKKQMVPKPD